MPRPILYTFRRCPYAMRARLAIDMAAIDIEFREILLRDKPHEMLSVSPKATVPVLQLANAQIIDESLDIMLWALEQNDPLALLKNVRTADVNALIERNDYVFKPRLDKYKYAVRFPEKSEQFYRGECDIFIQELNNLLSKNSYLFGNTPCLADYAIFPFVRQFANVDRIFFDNTGYEYLNSWLQKWTVSDSFTRIMIKREVWKGV
jgi:glutathione S-transferase